MQSILEKLHKGLEIIVDKVKPKVCKVVEEKIFSKINEKGLKTLSWISNVFSNILFIYIISSVFVSFHIFGLNAYYSSMNMMASFNWFTSFLLDVIIPMITSLIPYIVVRLISKLLEEKQLYDLDHKSEFFATGTILILNNISGIIRIIYWIPSMIQRTLWKGSLGIVDFINPFVNLIIPVIYIYIGYRYLMKSGYMTKINHEEI